MGEEGGSNLVTLPGDRLLAAAHKAEQGGVRQGVGRGGRTWGLGSVLTRMTQCDGVGGGRCLTNSDKQHILQRVTINNIYYNEGVHLL